MMRMRNDMPAAQLLLHPSTWLISWRVIKLDIQVAWVVCVCVFEFGFGFGFGRLNAK